MKQHRLKIRESQGTGKAVRGTKRTSTIQVTRAFGDGYLIVKQFRFQYGDPKSRARALRRAEDFIQQRSTKG